MFVKISWRSCGSLSITPKPGRLKTFTGTNADEVAKMGKKVGKDAARRYNTAFQAIVNWHNVKVL